MAQRSKKPDRGTIAAREALSRCVLTPPIAQERVAIPKDGMVRLSRRRAFADRTIAASMDPLSLLCRLATSVPPPRFHVAPPEATRRLAWRVERGGFARARREAVSREASGLEPGSHIEVSPVERG